MFQIKAKTGRKQKRNEKESGETNFLGLLWESFFRDNALVLRGTSSRDVIVLFKTASLSDDFGVRTHSKSFSQKFKNTPKSRRKPGENRKEMKKEPGETNFLGLLWESIFRDNALVLRGTSSEYLRIIRFS